MPSPDLRRSAGDVISRRLSRGSARRIFRHEFSTQAQTLMADPGGGAGLGGRGVGVLQMRLDNLFDRGAPEGCHR